MKFILSSRSAMISYHLVYGALKSVFKSPSSSGLQFAGHMVQAARRSASTPVVSAGRVYTPITKNQRPPVTSWNVRRLGEAT
jgi:hypothetical protein